MNYNHLLPLLEPYKEVRIPWSEVDPNDVKDTIEYLVEDIGDDLTESNDPIECCDINFSNHRIAEEIKKQGKL